MDPAGDLHLRLLRPKLKVYLHRLLRLCSDEAIFRDAVRDNDLLNDFG